MRDYSSICVWRATPRGASAWGLIAALTLAAVIVSPAANGQRRERSGAEVVEAVCVSCHTTGAEGAPKIGDAKAWAARASRGLAALTDSALKGIRNMPAHGGNPGVSDIEIERAVIQMVNQSGGRWIEPLGGATPAVVRSSEQIVRMHCAKCHQDGLEGAPRIGDRAAWIPRMKKGLDALVRSAVHGHGGMPARGGVADLSDTEVQGAAIYMFNYGVAMPVSTPAVAAAAGADPNHRLIAGTDIHLGVFPADSMRTGQDKGSVPSGKGYYHLNISLFDNKTKAAITDARVTVRVSAPTSTETKALELVSSHNTISYGAFFRMSGRSPYTIVAQIERPGVVGVTEVKFQHKLQ